MGNTIGKILEQLVDVRGVTFKVNGPDYQLFHNCIVHVDDIRPVERIMYIENSPIVNKWRWMERTTP